ncbi:MAG: 50S ribosomal protein L29 [Syntrophobacterales bacterium]|jgi:large subunit ribosomal protein L29
MKAADLRDLTTEELAAKLKEMNDELFKLRFQLSTNQLDNTGRLRWARRDLARLKTVLKEKTGENW